MKPNMSAVLLYQITMALVEADFSVAIIELTFKAFLVQTEIGATSSVLSELSIWVPLC